MIEFKSKSVQLFFGYAAANTAVLLIELLFERIPLFLSLVA